MIEQIYRWGVKWRSNNRNEGRREHLIYDSDRGALLFRTRKQARNYIKQRWGYIGRRPDLQREPHGWKVPKPVKLRITYYEVD